VSESQRVKWVHARLPRLSRRRVRSTDINSTAHWHASQTHSAQRLEKGTTARKQSQKIETIIIIIIIASQQQQQQQSIRQQQSRIKYTSRTTLALSL
jgi:hypothetical protein